MVDKVPYDDTEIVWIVVIYLLFICACNNGDGCSQILLGAVRRLNLSCLAQCRLILLCRVFAPVRSLGKGHRRAYVRLVYLN